MPCSDQTSRGNDGIAAAAPLSNADQGRFARITSPENEEPAADPSRHLAQCFLRLANLPTYPLDRLSRYEYALWRQVAQILFAPTISTAASRRRGGLPYMRVSAACPMRIPINQQETDDNDRSPPEKH